MLDPAPDTSGEELTHRRDPKVYRVKVSGDRAGQCATHMIDFHRESTVRKFGISPTTTASTQQGAEPAPSVCSEIQEEGGEQYGQELGREPGLLRTQEPERAERAGRGQGIV